MRNTTTRKLIDIPISNARKLRALEKFLTCHSIEYRKVSIGSGTAFRYYVQPTDLCCAQSVLLAMEGLDPDVPDLLAAPK